MSGDRLDAEAIGQAAISRVSGAQAAMSRRDVLAAAVGIAAAGAAGYGVGTAEAAASPSGKVGSTSEPLAEVISDRFTYHQRTSQPSRPSGYAVGYWREDKV